MRDPRYRHTRGTGVEMMEPNANFTVREVLERAIQIERRVADLYAVFAKQFSRVPGISEFWNDLRRDEIGHMGELCVIYESLPAEKLCSPESGAISASVNRALASVEGECLGKIKTLDDAYQIARELEFSEINAIFKYLTIDLVSPTSRSEIITYQVDEHQQKLVDFDKRYGDKNWRSQFSIQAE